MTDEWRERYTLYINSYEWQLKRESRLREALYTCERCGEYMGFPGKGLAVHHLNYDSLGDERSEDLKVVCHPCHGEEDELRARRGEHRRATARHDAGVGTFAQKKYGDDWEAVISWEEVSEEFDDWLESRA